MPGIVSGKLFKADIIISQVCKYFNTSPDKIKSKKRSMDLVLPRHIAMYLIRKNTPYALLNIGKLFYRDHTTVINAVKQIDNYYDTRNRMVIKAIDSISTNLKLNNDFSI